MRPPSFPPKAHEAGPAGRSVRRKLFALALFPFLLCVFTGSLGTCLQKKHDEKAHRVSQGELIDAPSETPSELWGMAFAFGLCGSSALSLLVGFAARPGRRLPFSQR